jgi:calcineurin-like phosphoesterase family protein
MQNPINANTWVASDHHFGHAKIGVYEPLRNIWKDLGYESHEDMVIKRHNEVVKSTDSVLFLGDFSWYDPKLFSGKLNGDKYLILGNHDRKGDQPYSDFKHVFRGIYVGHGDELYKSESIDPLLSAVMMPWGNKIVLFSHYSVGFDDPYDHQQAGLIGIRKDKIQDVINRYNVNKVVPINVHGHLHSKVAKDSLQMHYKNASLEQQMFYPVRLRDILGT